MLYLLVTHKRSVRITANNNLYIASFPESYESSLHLWSWSLLATLVSSLQGLRKFAGTEATWRISGSFKELRQPKGTEAAWGVYFCHSGLRRWGRLKELRQPDGSIFATLGWGGEAGCRNWGRLKGSWEEKPGCSQLLLNTQLTAFVVWPNTNFNGTRRIYFAKYLPNCLICWL